MPRFLGSSLEVLEARIAPASLTVFHPVPDLTPSFGKTGAAIDLGASLDSDPTAGYRPHVEFITNFDVDPGTPGLQPGKIVLELFSDKAPLTVQNFLSYVNSLSARGDYDGVFFHRLVSGFVLQTGGFEASTPTTHIPVGAAVHNEFDPNDVEQENVAGTVAMAKVGGDPNSATSEFFFNLGDNRSSIDPTTGQDIGLDHQNGGFTVFGKVVQGMDVINAIASLPTVTLGSFGAPYQNGYNPDPDHNANTASPTPKPNQLVAFSSVHVLPPKNSTVAGASYSVLGVFDQEGNPTNLVTTNANPATHRLIGDTLKLAYKPGGSGIATVKVQVTDLNNPGAAPLEEDFQVNLQPNLVASSGAETLPTAMVSGDTGVGTIKLFNSGGGAATGKVDVHYYLSHVDATTDPSGTILDSSDLLLGSVLGASVNLASGKTGSIAVPLTVPTDASLLDSGSYRVIAQVTASDGSTLAESHTDDNLATNGRVHGYFSGESKGNFSAVGVTDTLPRLLVPGDIGKASISFANNSSHLASGNVTISFYLSFDPNPGSSSTDSLTSADVLIGQETNQAISVPSGTGVTIDTAIAIPHDLTLADGYYHVFGVVGSLDGTSTVITPVAELSTADNVAGSSYHYLVHGFGNFNVNTLLGNLTRTNAVLSYSPDSEHLITLRLSGGGGGVISAADGSAITSANLGSLALAVDNTSLRSALSVIAPANFFAVFDHIYAGSKSLTPIGVMNLADVAIASQVVAFGGVRSLSLGGTTGTGDHFVGIDTSVAAAKALVRPVIALGSVSDLSLASNLPIASLSAVDWANNNADVDSVVTVGLTNFKVAGGFGANLSVSAANPALTPAVRNFEVDGTLAGSTVHIAANVGTIRLGAINQSTILVGTDVVPALLSDFNLPVRSIASLVIAGSALGQPSFSDSVIAAARIGSIAVSGQVDAASGDGPIGFIADKIALYRHGAEVPLRNLDTPGAFDTAAGGNYQVTVL